MIIQIITWIAKGIDATVTPILETRIEDWQRKISEVKAAGEYEVIKIAAPAEQTVAHEKTRQALLRAVGATFEKKKIDYRPALIVGGIMMFLFIMYIVNSNGDKKRQSGST